MDFKQELAKKADTKQKPKEVKLTKNMGISDMIKAMEPEIKKALPSVLTPERFTEWLLTPSAIHQSYRNVRPCHL